MKRGILLQVTEYNSKPGSMHTRFGKWEVLGTCSGSFEKVFNVLKRALNLKKVEELSSPETSFYAVQTWNGLALEEPIQAHKELNEFIPYEKAAADYGCFASLTRTCSGL
jgi:hypothetical protein